MPTPRQNASQIWKDLPGPNKKAGLKNKLIKLLEAFLDDESINDNAKHKIAKIRAFIEIQMNEL